MFNRRCSRLFGRNFSSTYIHHITKYFQNHKITKPKLQRSFRRLSSDQESRSFSHISLILYFGSFLGYLISKHHPALLPPEKQDGPHSNFMRFQCRIRSDRKRRLFLLRLSRGRKANERARRSTEKVNST